jgi:Flp pilus assembly protein TadD
MTAPLAAIDAGLLAWAVECAPATLHQSATAALTAAGSATASSLAKGATFMMTLKTNLAIAAVAGIVLIGGTTVVVVAAKGPTAAPTAQASPAHDPNKAMQLAQEGWQLWAQQQFAQAETRFSAATKLDASLTNAWNGLGWSQFNQGNSAAAQKSWEKTIALDPNFAGAQNGLGWIAFNGGDQAKAEKYFLASAKTPEASASWSGLARLYLLQGKWDEAKTWSTKLVDSGEESAKPWLAAALAQQVSDDLKKQIAPPPAPTPGEADVVKGWQMLNQNRAADAVAIFRVCVSKDPKDAAALNGLGWALMRTGNATEAQTQFEQTLKLDPNAGGAMNGLAMILKRQGKPDQAMELWKKLDESAANGETNAGTMGLARTYLEKKQYDKALPYYERLAKALPNDSMVQKGLQEARAGGTK